MKLLAIRDLNEQDPLPPLGKKVEPPAAPAPAPHPVAGKPWLIENPDGKLETAIPENKKAGLEAPDDRWAHVRQAFLQGKRTQMSFPGTGGIWYDMAPDENWGFRDPTTLYRIAPGQGA